MNLTRIQNDGFGANVDSYIVSAWGEYLYFVSMFGIASSVRSIVATLFSGREVTIKVGVDTKYTKHRHFFLQRKKKFRSIVKKLPCGQQHVIVYPEYAKVKDQGMSFLLICKEGPEPIDVLFRYVNSRVTVPMHKGWARWLWDILIERDMLIELESFGVGKSYECFLSDEFLEGMIVSAIEERKLKVKPLIEK